MFRRRRGPLEDVAHRLSAALEAASFHRGLAAGALIGAAIAGSTIWSRIREAQRPSRDQTPPEAPSQEPPTRRRPT